MEEKSRVPATGSCSSGERGSLRLMWFLCEISYYCSGNTENSQERFLSKKLVVLSPKKSFNFGRKHEGRFRIFLDASR